MEKVTSDDIYMAKIKQLEDRYQYYEQSLLGESHVNSSSENRENSYDCDMANNENYDKYDVNNTHNNNNHNNTSDSNSNSNSNINNSSGDLNFTKFNKKKLKINLQYVSDKLMEELVKLEILKEQKKPMIEDILKNEKMAQESSELMKCNCHAIETYCSVYTQLSAVCVNVCRFIYIYIYLCLCWCVYISI